MTMKFYENPETPGECSFVLEILWDSSSFKAWRLEILWSCDILLDTGTLSPASISCSVFDSKREVECEFFRRLKHHQHLISIIANASSALFLRIVIVYVCVKEAYKMS